MSSLTAFLGLTKPDSTEQYDVGVVNTNMDLIDAELADNEARLDTVDPQVALVDYAVGAGVVGAANWTLDTLKIYKVGRLVHVYFSVTRTTSAIASHATGNIANVALFTLPVGYRPVTDATWAGGGGLSNLMGAGMCQTTGTVFLSVIPPGIGVAIGDSLGGSLTFIQNG